MEKEVTSLLGAPLTDEQQSRIINDEQRWERAMLVIREHLTAYEAGEITKDTLFGDLEGCLAVLPNTIDYNSSRIRGEILRLVNGTNPKPRDKGARRGHPKWVQRATLGMMGLAEKEGIVGDDRFIHLENKWLELGLKINASIIKGWFEHPSRLSLE